MDKKEIEIPFGAFDSELMHQEINIPEGFEAEIKGNKIILKKTESEDEKVRKAIIAIISNYVDNSNTFKPKMITWLEKQGKESNDKNEPKFKVGDWVVWDNKITCHIDNIYQGKESLMYTITDDHNMTRSYNVKGFDNNAHLWTIDDAKDGDMICVKNAPLIYKHHDSRYIYTYCTLNFEGEFLSLTPLCWDIVTYYGEIFPATKEQRDLLFQKMKESGYEWNAEKKELKKIEDEEYNGEDYGIDGLWHAMNILEKTLGKVSGYQTDDGFLSHQCAITSVKKMYKLKPDWGEEDERIYQSIIDDTVQENQLDSKQIDWLKSIKSRVQPKQEWSEEDEELVKWSINNLTELKDRFGEEYGKVGKCIDWLKSLIPQNHWKTSKEQMSRLKWIAHQKARRL